MIYKLLLTVITSADKFFPREYIIILYVILSFLKTKYFLAFVVSTAQEGIKR